MQYHLSDGYETTWGNERANFYGLEYIPTLWFDGAINRVGVYPYSSLHADLEARHALSTDVTLVLSASQPAAGVLTVQALIGVEPGGVGKTMRVQIVQVLDHWPSAGGFHRNGFKQAAAAQIVSLTPGQSQVVERTFTLDTESWADLDHAGIVAWAEANTATLPLTVYQAAALPGPVYPDCNGNRVIDSDDIASGTSPDCNGNGTPDECEIPPLGSPNHDCNGNDVPDDCDLAAATSADCNADGVPDECELVAARGGSFDRFYAWAAFEPRQHGVGADAAGYMGAVFDGRYAYFVPYRTQTAAHGEVLRYDTTATFATAAAWAAYDPGAHGVGTDADGYNGAAFDGRHIYFAPYNNGTAYHGEVLRLDTAAPFAQATSWATYDPGANGIGADPDGYAGAVFDGRYVYFVPFHNGSTNHGEVLRYDTSAPFAAATAWAVYDPGAHGIGADPDGYCGAAFDGRYVYFAPRYNGTAYHGEVLRYDTSAPFADAGAWTTYDPGTAGVGTDADGYSGVVCDGRYLYFAPFHNGSSYHGEVLRYDTQAPFAAPASWSAYTPHAHGVGSYGVGFEGAICDGRFVYFVPVRDAFNHFHAEVLRYDTAAPFGEASSWNAFEPSSRDVGRTGAGFCGAASDGRYVYFAPYLAADGYHGEVLRYDALAGWDCDGNDVLDECDLAAGTWTDLNGSRIPDLCEGLGDLNCDGPTDFGDISPFVLALIGPERYAGRYPDCRWLNGDCNGDGSVDFDDISPFVALLVQR